MRKQMEAQGRCTDTSHVSLYAHTHAQIKRGEMESERGTAWRWNTHKCSSGDGTVGAIGNDKREQSTWSKARREKREEEEAMTAAWRLNRLSAKRRDYRKSSKRATARTSSAQRHAPRHRVLHNPSTSPSSGGRRRRRAQELGEGGVGSGESATASLATTRMSSCPFQERRKRRQRATNPHETGTPCHRSTTQPSRSTFNDPRSYFLGVASLILVRR